MSHSVFLSFLVLRHSKLSLCLWVSSWAAVSQTMIVETWTAFCIATRHVAETMHRAADDETSQEKLESPWYLMSS